MTVSCGCHSAGSIQAPGVPVETTSDSESPWAFELETFFQAARLETGGVDTIGGNSSDDPEIGFKDKNFVDPSGGMRASVRHVEGWGILLEASYLDAGDGLTPGRALSAPAFRHTQVELLYFTRLAARKVDLIAGLRGWSAHANWTARIFDTPGDDGSRSGEDQWVDPVVGVRWARPIRGPWSSTGRVDVGGFGIGSDLTWTVELGARYALDDRWSLNLEYKFQGIDFPRDEGRASSIGYDTILHGPRIGLVFGF